MGLRLEEALSLQIDDIDAGRQRVISVGEKKKEHEFKLC
jgi:integrase